MMAQTHSADSPPGGLDRHPAVDVRESEYRRLLGYPPGHEPGERALQLAAEARGWYGHNGKPWICICEPGSLSLEDGVVHFAGEDFSSHALHTMFEAAEAHRAVVVAVSAGSECEEYAQRLWAEGKPDEYFFLEVFGSAVVEHLVASAGFRLCDWAEDRDLAVLPHYSPGYPGWDIADQHRLFTLVTATGEISPGALRVMHTGMLQPKKSLLALFGLTARVEHTRTLAGMIPCERCSLASCRYRRSPYRIFLPQREDAGRRAVARTAPVYMTDIRALRKWARERLTVAIAEDRTVHALFRYDGTTCSTMGRPLEFHYDVTLSSAENGHRILNARCWPAPSDTGHLSMCEFAVAGNRLIEEIATEAPLIGRPLADILGWKRERSPAACFCTRESRAHKWGIVFEVLHYALTETTAPAPGGTS